MSDDEIINTALQEAQTTLREFEKEYENVDNDSNYWNLILGFTLIMILGSKIFKRKSYLIPPRIYDKLQGFNLGSRTFISTPENRKALEAMFNDYKGARKSLNKKLSQELLRQAKKNQKDIFENNIKQVGTSILAIDEGFTKVTAETKGDKRVRDSHRKNNGKTWNPKDYQPWLDYNCRCKYKFNK